jgi:glutamate-ammonia-ligase adenylyltransferase
LERQLTRWRTAADRQSDRAVADAMLALPADGTWGGVLGGILSHSPYLSESVVAEPELVVAIAERGTDAGLAACSEDLARLTLSSSERRNLMAGLRRAKRRLALVTALADLRGDWALERVTATLSDFADRSAGLALAQALHELAARGTIPPELAERPDRAGIVVIAMGKLGARELNYSSDIDLIVLFEPDRLLPTEPPAAMALAVGIVRTLVYLLSDQTRDGYVFRTDLRLRPHPAGHPLALSVDDALEYYERHGQNWERAALIKARPCAGDPTAGAAFMDGIRPFVWRRSLDYAAVLDIHAIKRQIDRHRGHGAIKLAGHDLKVGRGGIREIEFFVQTQQLILGGRHADLRTSGTCTALGALADGRWIDRRTAAELTDSYAWLRRAEHRLQMLEDKQTQRVPEKPRELERFTAFMGYADVAAFEGDLHRHLQQVERHYAALFESSPGLGAGGALVFTGMEDDPETIETLRAHGFQEPETTSRRIRQWHHGHIRATRSPRARELLTALMPELVRALGRQASPDAAFARFDRFLGQLPTGVQLFALFHATPRLLTLMADLMGMAPRLADHLARHTALFEAMLLPAFLDERPDRPALVAEAARETAEATDSQDLLDRLRRWAHGRQFQLALGVLLGRTDGATIGRPLTTIAVICVEHVLAEVERALAHGHGRIPRGRFCVLAMGKLGSRELGIGSDLDLIFLFDAPEGARSDGERPLPPDDYFARLAQRFTGALAARTSQGRLFEIDTRLRPSGNVGPLVSRVDAFAGYQVRTAQTWEHQSLTRARPIAGDAQLQAEAAAAAVAALKRPRDRGRLAADVVAMRERIFRDRGTDDPWQLKRVRGGVIDLEFLAQYLRLAYPDVMAELPPLGTVELFVAAGSAGLLTADQGRVLRAAGRLYRRLDAVLRLAVEGDFDAETAPAGLKLALARAAAPGEPLDEAETEVDFARLETQLRAAQQDVARLFQELIGAHATPPEETTA